MIRPGANARKMGDEMNTIVIVVLVLLLVGVLPTWPHSADWGYFTSGGLGLILLVLVILALTGRLGRQARGETVTTVQTRARHPRSVARDWRRSKEPGCVTSCEGHDHENHSDPRHCAHHCAHHARRRGVRLQGIPYTTRERVIDLGPLQATVDKKETIPWRRTIGSMTRVGKRKRP